MLIVQMTLILRAKYLPPLVWILHLNVEDTQKTRGCFCLYCLARRTLVVFETSINGKMRSGRSSGEVNRQTLSFSRCFSVCLKAAASGARSSVPSRPWTGTSVLRRWRTTPSRWATNCRTSRTSRSWPDCRRRVSHGLGWIQTLRRKTCSSCAVGWLCPLRFNRPNDSVPVPRTDLALRNSV